LVGRWGQRPSSAASVDTSRQGNALAAPGAETPAHQPPALSITNIGKAHIMISNALGYICMKSICSQT